MTDIIPKLDNDKNPITRVDLEEVAKGYVLIDGWYDGWLDGEASKYHSAVENDRLDAILAELEKQGFCVRIYRSGTKAQALRGKITRIDFLLGDGKWTVAKYPYGWKAGTPALSRETKGDKFNIDKSLAWLADKGWTVVQWPGGARTWWGGMKPIRSREEILAMRRDQESKHLADGWHYDLAFYY